MGLVHIPGITASTSIVLLFFMIMSLYYLCQLAIAGID